MSTKRNTTVETSITFKGYHLTVCGYFTAGSPGRYSGPPEDCFPAEPSEFEIESIEWVDEDGRSHEQLLELIADHILDSIADEAAAEYETSLREEDDAAAEGDYWADRSAERSAER